MWAWGGGQRQVYPRDAAPGHDKPSVIVNLACAGSGGRVILPKHEGQTDSFQAEINGKSNYCYGRRGGVLVTTVGPTWPLRTSGAVRERDKF